MEVCYKLDETEKRCYNKKNPKKWSMEQMNELVEKEKWKLSEIIAAIPVILAIAFVPLIVTVKKYDIGLENEPWFMNTESGIDLFLYWKGRMLVLLAVIMLVFGIGLIKSAWQKKKQEINLFSIVKERIKKPEMVCLLVYFVFSLVSSFLSENRDIALFGGYEQWEGMNVLAAYVVLLLYVYLTTGTEKTVRLFMYSLVAGAFVIGLIGAFQYFRMDFFRSEAGLWVMNIMSSTKMNFSFSFPDGWVYATLYNPNYVGSYAALLLPVVVVIASSHWKMVSRFFNVMSLITVFLLVVTLIGSQSLTGCIGVIAGTVFFLLFRIPAEIKKNGALRVGVCGAGIVLAAALFCFIYPDTVKKGWDKLVHPTEDTHTLHTLADTEQGLLIKTVEEKSVYLTFSETGEVLFAVQNEQGEAVPLMKAEGSDYYVMGADGFSGIQLKPSTVKLDNQTVLALVLTTTSNGKQWSITKWDDKYKIINAYQKLDDLKEIPQSGFEGKQHFADKRGYIWSRTIPLLKDYIITGAGPDNFISAFPNDDYVGKYNMEYAASLVTKPHNMYLQIWVQTGFVSLLGFLGVFLLYFIKSVRLYIGKTADGFLEKAGIAILVGVTGYMVTGLANDSTVTVAPVFFGMMGIGMAVNHMVEKNNRE